MSGTKFGCGIALCHAGIWERLHYDWSDRNRVVMTTTDSN